MHMYILFSLSLSPDEVERLLLVEAKEPSPVSIKVIPLALTAGVLRLCPVPALNKHTCTNEYFASKTLYPLLSMLFCLPMLM